MVITTQADLEQPGPGVGGFLRDGTPIPRHVAQMLGCDAARVDITLGKQGEVLDVKYTKAGLRVSFRRRPGTP